MDFIKDFIHEHFVAAGYNIFNTVTYGLILGLSVFGIIKLINLLKIRVDRNFAVALAPFIFFGATTRVLSDAGFFSGYSYDMALTPFMFNYWVVSPGIFVSMFALTIALLAFSIFIEKISKEKINYYIPMVLFGSVLALHNLIFILPR